MTRLFKSVLSFLTLTICLYHFAIGQLNIEYDVVLTGGRVIDPETKLDALKNVGVTS